MRYRLFVVHGSHPCAAVEKALQLKGIEYSVVEWPPPMQVPLQRMIFGGRTVPGLQINGEKVHGSRAIMRRLDELVPEPWLYPRDPAQLERVEEADRWGDEVFQPVARELLWAGFVNRPAAMVSYSEHSRLPLPPVAVRAIAPAIARAGRRLNQTSDAVAQRDLRALPAQLDQIDAWISEGRIGVSEHPNAADLQILSTVRLLMTVADARAVIGDRPAAQHALGLFPSADGELPAGSLPAA